MNSYNPAGLSSWTPAYSWSVATWTMCKRLSYMIIPAYTGTVSTDYLKLPMYSLVNSFNYIRNSLESPWDCQILCSGRQSGHLSLQTVSINWSMHNNGNLWDLLLCCEAGIAESWWQIPGISSGHNTANSMEKNNENAIVSTDRQHTFISTN